MLLFFRRSQLIALDGNHICLSPFDKKNCLVGGSNNFWYSFALLILSSQVVVASFYSKKVSLFILVVIWKNDYNLV